jgi:hypothetical protein
METALDLLAQPLARVNGYKRSGSGNSDSWISGDLASQSRSQDRIQEQEHDKENKMEGPWLLAR